MAYAGMPPIKPYQQDHIFFCPSARGKPVVKWDSDPVRDQGCPYYSTANHTYGFNSHLQGIMNPQYLRMSELTDTAHVIWSTDATSHRIDRSYWGSFPVFVTAGIGREGSPRSEARDSIAALSTAMSSGSPGRRFFPGRVRALRERNRTHGTDLSPGLSCLAHPFNVVRIGPSSTFE